MNSSNVAKDGKCGDLKSPDNMPSHCQKNTSQKVPFEDFTSQFSTFSSVRTEKAKLPGFDLNEGFKPFFELSPLLTC
jgi:hypothetical protein